MKHILITLTLLSILSATSAVGQTKKLSSGSFEFDKRERKYTLYIPSGYDKKKPVPLLIGLHAGMSNPKVFMERTKFTAIAERENFIAVFPQGSAFREKRNRFVWNSGSCCGYAAKRDIDDVGFIQKLISKLGKSYNIDAQRIYATGFSNGGGMSYRLACELSDKIAGIAVVSSSLDLKKCTLNKPVNILHIHGTADPYNLYEGGTSSKGLSKKAKNSTANSLAVMRKQNHCPQTPTIEQREDLTLYSSLCKDKSRVVHIKINKGEHAWPGSTMPHKSKKTPEQRTTRHLNASEKIWEFFSGTSSNQ